MDNLLKYGVPVAGSVVGGLIQSNAAGNSSAAQQAYLEEALAYQKEQDALNRARQTGLDTLAQQQDARNFARLTGLDQVAQQQDLRNYETSQQHYQNNVGTEAGRYGDFSNNIAPFIASGSAANAKAAKLLGLDSTPFQTAPRPGSSSFTPTFTDFAKYGPQGPTSYVDPASVAGQLPAADKAKIDALLKASNSADDPNYWYGIAAQHGGFDTTGADWLKGRISTGDGAGKGYVGTTAPEPTVSTQPPMPRAGGDASTPPPAAAPQGQMITIQAPDGSTKQVPASEANHWQSVGAKILQGAAA